MLYYSTHESFEPADMLGSLTASRVRSILCSPFMELYNQHAAASGPSSYKAVSLLGYRANLERQYEMCSRCLSNRLPKSRTKTLVEMKPSRLECACTASKAAVRTHYDSARCLQ